MYVCGDGLVLYDICMTSKHCDNDAWRLVGLTTRKGSKMERREVDVHH